MSRLLSRLRLLVSLLYIAEFYAPEIGFGREPLDLAAFLLSVTCRVMDGMIRSRRNNRRKSCTGSSINTKQRLRSRSACGGFGPIRASSGQ